MKCQKCGASLPDGNLYCHKCGEEYKIVPDFEPEIENSIARTMSFVGDSIEFKEDNVQPKESDNLSSENEGKRKWIYPGMVLAGCLLALMVIGILFFVNSDFYYRAAAQKAIEEQKYDVALEYYDKLRRRQPDNPSWYLEEARLELLYGDQDTAKQLAYRGINETDGSPELYLFLVDQLIHEKVYQDAYEILKNCPYEKIKDRYKEYDSYVGALSHESGNYDTIVKLSIKDSSKFVYYTTDGTIPDQSSLLYEEPIILGNGIHTVTLLPANEYGVLGEVVRKEYTVKTDIPMSPIVEPDSGELEEAVLISLQTEPGNKVFYTTDGSIPDHNSLVYEEAIPVPLGESTFNFIAISENGEKSEVIERKYLLRLSANISTMEAENILVNELIQREHILDQNGAIKDRYGVFRYFYKFPVKAEGRTFYVFEEHYLENLIDNPLRNYYGVDMISKEVFPLKKDFLGKYYLDIFKN